MSGKELLALARKHMWAAWQLSAEELASQAASTLLGLGMLVPEGGAAELEKLRVRVAELEAERHTTNEALDDAVRALRNHDHVAEAYPGELAMLRGLVATLRVVAEHGDLTDVAKLLDEHQRDEQDAYAETGGV